MAVQDPQDQQPPPTHPQVQRLIDAAQVGAVVKASGAAVTAPSFAVTLPATAAKEILSVPAEALAHGVKIALILRILRALFRRRRVESVGALEKELRKRFPGLDDVTIRRIVQQEAAYEDAFQRKATRRVEADLQAAGQLATKEQQSERVKQIVNREKHYGVLRERAMWARAIQRGENEIVRIQSPLGAKWVLGAAKNHTLGCLALAGKNWPWAVLDTIPPPLHTNCQCSLEPLGPNDTVPPDGEAMAMARRAIALEEAIYAVADPGEIEACLDGQPVRPSIERALVELLEVDYREGLHPRGRGGRWIAKLGKKRILVKGDKKLTKPQVHAAVRKVAQGLVDFYGGDKADVEAHHEPEYIANMGQVASFRHQGELMAGINYGREVMEDLPDPEFGVHNLRIVAHEAAHSLSGVRPGPYPGFSQTFEEGGAEVLSLWFWHHRMQPFDQRDAVRVRSGDGPTRWSEPGIEALAHSVVYRPYVEELMRRAASKVGWDRTKMIDEIERVMRGDHTVRLHFRDQTDEHFPLPEDLPETARGAFRDDEHDHAVALIHWLLSPETTQLGGDWKGNEGAIADAHRALTAVTDRYDVPLKHVNVDKGATDDVGRFAGKSKDTIYLAPRFVDDGYMAARKKEFRGAFVEVPNDSHGRVRTITHEYAHILDGELLHHHKDAYKKLDAFLNEQGSYGMPGTRTRLQAGLEAPSAYGTENRYEFVAEALTDWIHNGEQAHSSSQFIGKLFDEYLGRKAELRESVFTEWLHPRGRSGRWVEAIAHAEPVHEPSRHEGFTGEDFARALDGFEHGGIVAVRANRTQTQNLYGEVWLNLQRSGESAPVGLARVTLKPPNNRGERHAELSNIYLREADQGNGFGRAFTDHLLGTLRNGGVDNIDVEAVSIGGYAWARRGFVWTGDKAAVQREILQAAKDDGRWSRMQGHLPEERYAELERKLAAGEFSSEAELAAYGIDQWWWDEHEVPRRQDEDYVPPVRERTWLGKELLIGSRWKGSRPVVVQEALTEEVYAEALHPRGRGGEWIAKFGEALKQLPKPSLRGRGGGVLETGGHAVRRTRQGYEVTHATGDTTSYRTAEDAAKDVAERHEAERLHAEAEAEIQASRREREQRRTAERNEANAKQAARTWYRFESAASAQKIKDTGVVWGLPGYQGRAGVAKVRSRADPSRRGDDRARARQWPGAGRVSHQGRAGLGGRQAALLLDPGILSPGSPRGAFRRSWAARRARGHEVRARARREAGRPRRPHPKLANVMCYPRR